MRPVSITERLMKPPYVYRPRQILRRLARDAGPTVRTPWGIDIETPERDQVLGGALRRSAVYELVVSETAWRLCDPADAAIDAGANVGYYTGLLAVRAASVDAIEPHPDLRAMLE